MNKTTGNTDGKETSEAKNRKGRRTNESKIMEQNMDNNMSLINEMKKLFDKQNGNFKAE